MLYGVQTADLFLDCYQKYANDLFTYDPYWDFVSLVDVLSNPIEVETIWISRVDEPCDGRANG